jgi:DNA-binding CsgD family transcriptional regulator
MERWMQTCRRELLDRTLIWNQRHLLHALRGPGGGGVCAGAEDPDAPGGVFDDGEAVQARPGQGAGLEEVTGQQGVGLTAQEAGPGCRPGAGATPCSFTISQMVEAATLMPRAASSPWMRRYPREEFSRARRRTRARIERTVRGRPRRLSAQVAAWCRGRPEEALPLIERGVAFSRTFGQPIQLANALLSQAPALRALGEHQRAADAIAEARSILESCPDPGILAGRLAALDRPPQIRRVLSGDQELTQRELRALRLLNSDLSEQDIGRELYVAHNTVHSHVRSIYRKLAVSSRADALERGRQLGLL